MYLHYERTYTSRELLYDARDYDERALNKKKAFRVGVQFLPAIDSLIGNYRSIHGAYIVRIFYDRAITAVRASSYPDYR